MEAAGLGLAEKEVPMSRESLTRLAIALTMSAGLAMAVPAAAASATHSHAESPGILEALWQWLVGSAGDSGVALPGAARTLQEVATGEGSRADPAGAVYLERLPHLRLPRISRPSGRPFRSISAPEGGAMDPNGSKG
jgi:hypothetical protein